MFKKLGATLAALTALVHIFVGHFDVLLPLLVSDISPMVVGTFHVCWHMISVFLVYSAWCFWHGGQVALHMALLWLVFAGIFIIVGLWQIGFSGLLVLPQWVLLGPAGGCILRDYYSNASRRPAG